MRLYTCLGPLPGRCTRKRFLLSPNSRSCVFSPASWLSRHHPVKKKATLEWQSWSPRCRRRCQARRCSSRAGSGTKGECKLHRSTQGQNMPTCLGPLPGRCTRKRFLLSPNSRSCVFSPASWLSSYHPVKKKATLEWQSWSPRCRRRCQARSTSVSKSGPMATGLRKAVNAVRL